MLDTEAETDAEAEADAELCWRRRLLDLAELEIDLADLTDDRLLLISSSLLFLSSSLLFLSASILLLVSPLFLESGLIDLIDLLPGNGLTMNDLRLLLLADFERLIQLLSLSHQPADLGTDLEIDLLDEDDFDDDFDDDDLAELTDWRSLLLAEAEKDAETEAEIELLLLIQFDLDGLHGRPGLGIPILLLQLLVRPLVGQFGLHGRKGPPTLELLLLLLPELKPEN